MPDSQINHTFDLMGQTGLQKRCIAMTIQPCTEKSTAVSHTEIVTGQFVRQKTKRVLEEEDIYL